MWDGGGGRGQAESTRVGGKAPPRPPTGISLCLGNSIADKTADLNLRTVYNKNVYGCSYSYMCFQTTRPNEIRYLPPEYSCTPAKHHKTSNSATSPVSVAAGAQDTSSR